jgi:hypothetical protein
MPAFGFAPLIDHFLHIRISRVIRIPPFDVVLVAGLFAHDP